MKTLIDRYFTFILFMLAGSLLAACGISSDEESTATFCGYGSIGHVEKGYYSLYVSGEGGIKGSLYKTFSGDWFMVGKDGYTEVEPRPYFAFEGNLVSFEIPKTVKINKKYRVTRIAQEAFYENEKLRSVEIPNSITSIGIRAFAGCKSLKKVEIPKSVKKIETCAFARCSKLTEVRIPKSAEVADDAFAQSPNVKVVYY